MTETAVPDDLMKVAREVADDHDAKMKSLCGPTASTRRAYMIELVARALAAERERATLVERERGAGIAKKQAAVDKGYDLKTSADGIATDILSGLSLLDIDNLGRNRLAL